MDKYVILLIQTCGILLFGFECIGLKASYEFYFPTPEQNYKNLIEVARGVRQNKQSLSKQMSEKSSKSQARTKSYQPIKEAPLEKKSNVESPEIIKEDAKSESKESEQAVLSQTSPNLPEIEEPNGEEISEIEEKPQIPQEKIGWFPFKPFAETARAVGIPALSSYKAASDSYASFGGILDSTALLGIYYFDYDRLAVDGPKLDGKQDAWISKSLLSLIYKSEQEDPLSFLILGYGISTLYWEGCASGDRIEASETAVEGKKQEYDSVNGDIIFDS